MSGRPTGDLRRHVTHASHGALLMMVGAQSALDDIEGGVRAGQWQLVLAQTRTLVMICCQVHGLASGAEPYVAEDGAAIDPYTDTPAKEWDEAVRLLYGAAELAAHPDRAPRWLDELHTWVDAAEASLGLDAPLPQLRSSGGMFAALRLVRGWNDLIEELALPSLLPREWTKPL
ncbi:hypothetical protein A6A06_01755 [Streptomyces sp. CB02923]|uniref:hypothetical protein n=1 Tax=Streptomyces sp. CB02923 TaxID=1718985 RepID=UPI00096416ED|nr:hypothetical protein [Streptomyces sp. CB02923]OKI09454.1 hypothetical protein A6A06_01755 [Streptomyces sp. CB02923]